MWVVSLIVITLANVLPGRFEPMTYLAAMIGITSLIFAARGNAWAPILMIVFCILYAILSWERRYWGELITYVGMTLPMNIWATFAWLRNPSKEREGEVAIGKLSGKHWGVLIAVTIVVTALFYWILKWFDTPYLGFSTLSVTTSFMAVALTMLRSSHYALLYAANDIVLMVLWSLACLEDPVYFPVVVNFAIFLVNDLYGFFNWMKREKE